MTDRGFHLSGFAVLIGAVCVGIAGCGSAPSQSPDTHAAESPAAAEPPAVESPAAEPAGDTATLDACALVSQEDVTTLIGVTVYGVPSGVGGRTGCVWENPETYESVTVDIGAPGTALNDTLPPLSEPGFPDVQSTPGPDGTRILAGAVEFAAANRYNSVQVATPVTMTPDESIAAAVDLIGKIKPQLPG